ncbi:hypothetical protein HYS96_04270 [Candidatus Daviesbacteria bacterium]|nr:hypothetical protein [Candidatus Daviesbacteria bacterium]
MTFKIKNLKYIFPVLLIILFIVLVKVQNRVATCTITPAVLNTSDVDGSTVNLTWANGQNSKITYLNVSTSRTLNPDGSLETPDIVNDVVTNKNSYSKSDFRSGTYYWNIVSDGCRQRKVSNQETFTVYSKVKADCELKSAVLGTPVVKGANVTFNWTNDQNTEATYINVSSSNTVNANGVLEKVDIANDVVTSKTYSMKEISSPGTYYWNIASDGCGQRKMSDLGAFTVQ